MGDGGRCEVTARGKSDDAHAVGADSPFRSVRPHRSQRALGIQKRNVRAPLGQAIFQHDAGDAMFVQPFGNAMAFAILHQHAISASRADHHCRSVRLLRWRTMHGDRDINLLRGSVAHRRDIGPDGESLALGLRPSAADRDERDGRGEEQAGCLIFSGCYHFMWGLHGDYTAGNQSNEKSRRHRPSSASTRSAR